MQYKQIVDEIYDTTYHMLHCKNEHRGSVAKRYLPKGLYNVLRDKDNFFDGDVGGLFTLCSTPGGRAGIIFIDSTSNTSFKRIACVHECLHATLSVLENAGLSPEFGGQEAFTYYQGWLVREVWKGCGV